MHRTVEPLGGRAGRDPFTVGSLAAAGPGPPAPPPLADRHQVFFQHRAGAAAPPPRAPPQRQWGPLPQALLPPRGPPPGPPRDAGVPAGLRAGAAAAALGTAGADGRGPPGAGGPPQLLPQPRSMSPRPPRGHRRPHRAPPAGPALELPLGPRVPPPGQDPAPPPAGLEPAAPRGDTGGDTGGTPGGMGEQQYCTFLMFRPAAGAAGGQPPSVCPSVPLRTGKAGAGASLSPAGHRGDLSVATCPPSPASVCVSGLVATEGTSAWWPVPVTRLRA
ncbi:basic salivary proline-rich protein 1-like [Harpia harpyja]|uniref:basic salivary proline-rich protein 1-like n=1 Tax=Harpia harpyja TaxID=202280 RepID=UPI0022B1F2C7|nr:basic salivary proline-rich protein 1-like [Harpia harpyja]